MIMIWISVTNHNLLYNKIRYGSIVMSIAASKQMFSSVQLLSHVQLFETPWTAAHQTSLSITNPQSPPKPMSIGLVMPSNHLILCCPILLLPLIFPSIRIFPNKLALRIRWSKYWSFSFNIIPSNEYSGLIFFKIDWFDLLAVQGTFPTPQFKKHHFFSAELSL